jgi:hypothetical protein
MSCSSDERLKTNITDLSSNVLDSLMNVQTKTFNWKNGDTETEQIGFIAQNIDEYFPQLITTGSNGYLQVNYAGMAPVLVKSIQELNLKIDDLSNTATENSLRASLIAWFGDVANGIGDLFVNRIRTNELCVGTTCLDESQVQMILDTMGGSYTSSPIPDNDTTSGTGDSLPDPSGDTETPPVSDTPPSGDGGTTPDTGDISEPENPEPEPQPEPTPEPSSDGGEVSDSGDSSPVQ